MRHALPLLITLVAVGGTPATDDWKTDPAWDRGPAEWALYDAERVIYGEPRSYEATIFTNTQRMDPETTTKADGDAPGLIDVFKHNVSEMVPTENYTYRFTTTSFVTVDTLETYKLVASTQEDCGATYRRFVVDDEVDVIEFCYFPDAGQRDTSYPTPDGLVFHDTLSLVLRDYPFDAPATMTIPLVADQTHTRPTVLEPREATVRYVERETIEVPYGAVDTHHLVVEHERDGNAIESHYWFAADPDLRHVMVQFEGPYGISYRLKRLEWWAYWEQPLP